MSTRGFKTNVRNLQTQESLALLKIIAQGRANVASGRVKPLRQAFADVRKLATST